MLGGPILRGIRWPGRRGPRQRQALARLACHRPFGWRRQAGRRRTVSHGDELHYDGHAASRAGDGGLMGLGFSHLVLEVSDLDRSEAWYRDVIGIDLLGRGLMAEPRPHVVLQLGTGQVVVLVEVERPQPRRPYTAAIHHAFLLTMDQFRAAQARLAAAGYEIADARAAFRAKGEYSFDVNDPDGHRWQVQAFGPEQHELLKPGVGVVDC